MDDGVSIGRCEHCFQFAAFTGFTGLGEKCRACRDGVVRPVNPTVADAEG